MNRVLRDEIARVYKTHKIKSVFVPGVSYVPVSGKVFDTKELTNGVEAILDGWWTEGRFAIEFERLFKKTMGVNYVSLVNSGSSANLVALTSLTSTLFGDRALKPGDEIITVATGFPTTVNPILQIGCTPVFIDIDIGTKNATVEAIQKAITKKTRAIMMAHTLGNPMPLDGIMKLVEKYKLWFIEDCCDGLGGTYGGKNLGTLGHVATFSFYPAHQITMGEGGAIVTNNPLIHRSVRQFRDWGRDCWCATGKDNTCGKRFGWKMGELPRGYDHKYIYSQIGYNLKLTDMQAAIGVAQLTKLDRFVEARRKNFEAYYEFFQPFDKYFIIPQKEKESNPSWFGFMLVVKDDAPFTRDEIVSYLEDHKIGTRPLFAGNLLKHPAYIRRKDIRVIGDLKTSDYVMNNGFWIGVYPGITPKMRKYVMRMVSEFIDTLK